VCWLRELGSQCIPADPRFVHLSFQEYYAAKHLVQQIVPAGATTSAAAAAAEEARDAFVRRAVGKDLEAANSLAFLVPFGFKLGDVLEAELDHGAKMEGGADVTDVYAIHMTTPADLARARSSRSGASCGWTAAVTTSRRAATSFPSTRRVP